MFDVITYDQRTLECENPEIDLIPVKATAAEPKGLLIIPGAVHVDLYDQRILFLSISWKPFFNSIYNSLRGMFAKAYVFKLYLLFLLLFIKQALAPLFIAFAPL